MVRWNFCVGEKTERALMSFLANEEKHVELDVFDISLEIPCVCTDCIERGLQTNEWTRIMSEYERKRERLLSDKKSARVDHFIANLCPSWTRAAGGSESIPDCSCPRQRMADEIRAFIYSEWKNADEQRRIARRGMRYFHPECLNPLETPEVVEKIRVKQAEVVEEQLKKGLGERCTKLVEDISSVWNIWRGRTRAAEEQNQKKGEAKKQKT